MVFLSTVVIHFIHSDIRREGGRMSLPERKDRLDEPISSYFFTQINKALREFQGLGGNCRNISSRK
jgi:hypothetical protein